MTCRNKNYIIRNKESSHIKIKKISLLDSTWASSILFESLEMVIVSDWETDGNDSITDTCPCTFGVFLGPMPLLDLEDKSRIGV